MLTNRRTSARRSARKRPSALAAASGPAPSAAHSLIDRNAPAVLVVDDNRANLAAFDAILAEPGVRLVTAQSGAEAMRHLLTGEFAAILLDINMPDLDGIQTAELIRKRERSRDIPIIFITAYHVDQMQMLKGYASGAVDYLVKPVSPEILRSKVRVFVDLYHKKQQVEWQASQLRAVNARLQREINERQEAERDAVFEREERQRVTLACIADGVITIDAAGRVTFLNPTAEQLTGWSGETACGLSLPEVFDLRPNPPAPGVAQVVEACLQEDRIVRVSEQATLITTSGACRYVEYSVAPVHDSKGRTVGAVLIAHDVTERHHAEVERERILALEQAAREAAEEANIAKDEFLAVISHELRTPLNAIMGWTHVLRQVGAVQGLAGRALDAIARSAMAQEKLIADLLDMSRIIHGKVQLTLQPLQPAVVIRAAVETVRPLADEKRIALKLVLDESIDDFMGDRSRMEQVIWNVLSNAVKFTPDEGQVEVQLSRVHGCARISVTDSGMGIEPEFVPHVFERFRQADSTTTRRYGGLGLGLSIARQILSMHAGSIAVHSAGPGLGATFTITLPLGVRPGLDPESATGRNASGPPPVEAGHGLLSGVRVLLVDDDRETLDLLVTVIRSCGGEARATASARDAMSALGEWRPNVLVSDISMPGEDGYSLIRRVRALPASEGGSTPALALTAMAADEDRGIALGAGFDVHLAKPVHPEQVISAIATLAARADRHSTAGSHTHAG
jgi:PAS domain S-box-containing protein